MALPGVAEFTTTKRLMVEAGIDLDTVLRDGITDEGYLTFRLDENGKRLVRNDCFVTNFVEWPDAVTGAEIWKSYKREAGFTNDQ